MSGKTYIHAFIIIDFRNTVKNPMQNLQKVFPSDTKRKHGALQQNTQKKTNGRVSKSCIKLLIQRNIRIIVCFSNLYQCKKMEIYTEIHDLSAFRYGCIKNHIKNPFTLLFFLFYTLNLAYRKKCPIIDLFLKYFDTSIMKHMIYRYFH